jgi:hypothetical protein
MAAGPAGFEPNVGQFASSVRYAARGAGHTLLVTFVHDHSSTALPVPW